MKQLQVLKPKPASPPAPLDQRTPSGKPMVH